MTRIIVIRHCEAFGNHMRVFQGHTDADVSENGKKQLERLAERFRSIPYDAIYSSPLRRALATAQAANRYHELPIQLCEGLVEINGGDWEGVKWADLPERFPAEYRDWAARPQVFEAPHGESMHAVYDRVWEAVTGIAREYEGKTVVCVSHGCAIRNLLCRAQGWPIDRLDEVAWCDNTAVSVLDFDAMLRPAVVLMNDASHLDETLSTLARQDWWRPENKDRFLTD